MNKRELAEAVAERLNSDPRTAERHINAVLEEIGRAMVRGEDVLLTGFGTFLVKKRAERPARNMQTGERVIVPARPAVAFRTGARLRKHVRGEIAITENINVTGKSPKTRKTAE